jgi:hypothetical protein
MRKVRSVWLHDRQIDGTGKTGVAVTINRDWRMTCYTIRDQKRIDRLTRVLDACCDGPRICVPDGHIVLIWRRSSRIE